MDAMQYKDEYMFFHPDDYDYEELNSKESAAEKFMQDVTSSLVGSSKEVKKMTTEDIFASMNDDNILTL